MASKTRDYLRWCAGGDSVFRSGWSGSRNPKPHAFSVNPAVVRFKQADACGREAFARIIDSNEWLTVRTDGSDAGSI
jgi:hypothetical protein